MKTLSFIFLLFFLATDGNKEVIHSESYLQIKTANTDISYPPRTAFELYDSKDVLIFTQDDLPERYEISSTHKLVLHPSWRKEEEVYRLEKATLEMHTHGSEPLIRSTEEPDHNNLASYVAATKVVSSSSDREDQYNLTLNFTNGLVFNYTDGKTDATLNNELLKIEGKYVINSNLGTYKISFNPANGETWWVFEANKK